MTDVQNEIKDFLEHQFDIPSINVKHTVDINIIWFDIIEAVEAYHKQRTPTELEINNAFQPENPSIALLNKNEYKRMGAKHFLNFKRQ